MLTSLLTITVTLILVMDPLGNIPIFLSVLHSVDPKRRPGIIIRECVIAFFILTIFLFFGQHILHALGISMSALSIAGGIILFLIALRMIFPANNEDSQREASYGEPFIVPLAIPLVAGPSAIATILLFASHDVHLGWLLIALALATSVSLIILLFSEQLRKLLGKKGLVAIERLMGMVLTTIAVQMFLNGLSQYFNLGH